MATYAAAGERCRDDPQLLSAIALGHEDAYLASGIERRTSGDPSIELLERARSTLGAQDPASLALTAAVARAYWFSGFADRARELLADIAATELAVDDATAMRVLDLRRLVAGDPASAAARRDVIDEMFAVAERAGRFEVALDALRARILTSVELARLDDADDDIDRFARLVERWREPHFRPFVPILRTMRAMQAGRFADAAKQIARSERDVVAAGPSIPHQLILMQRYSLARWWERAPDAPLDLVDELRVRVALCRAGARPQSVACPCATASERRVILLDAAGLAASRPGRPLFADVSVTVASGDRLAVVGLNGCGKSTLLRQLAGRVEPEAGVVRRGRGARVVVLDQDAPLPGATIGDVTGRTWEAAAILDRLGLGGRLDDPTATLSGGETKRVALARALVEVGPPGEAGDDVAADPRRAHEPPRHRRHRLARGAPRRPPRRARARRPTTATCSTG